MCVFFFVFVFFCFFRFFLDCKFLLVLVLSFFCLGLILVLRGVLGSFWGLSGFQGMVLTRLRFGLLFKGLRSWVFAT